MEAIAAKSVAEMFQILPETSIGFDGFTAHTCMDINILITRL